MMRNRIWVVVSFLSLLVNFFSSEAAALTVCVGGPNDGGPCVTEEDCPEGVCVAVGCTASFTILPQFIVSCQGTCADKRAGTNPQRDTLTVDIQPRPDCDACNVSVKTEWPAGVGPTGVAFVAGSQDWGPKGPSNTDDWPHDV